MPAGRDQLRGARAFTFRIDVHGADVTKAFRAAGVRPLLLKGPSFSDLLYRDGAPRMYTDVDLLVDVRTLAAAQRVLLGFGFVRHLALADDPASDAGHAEAWFSEARQIWIDLHTSLPDVAAPPAVVWEMLRHHVRSLEVGGDSADVLDAPASALLTALHAAHHVHAASTNSAEDLRRAAAQFDMATWHQAKELAAAIDGVLPFTVGLHSVGEGRAVADAMDLPLSDEVLRYRALRAAGREARVLDHLRRADRRTAARIVARTIVPTAPSLRQSSGLARRGRRGLAAAYVLRPVVLVLRLPRAMADARRARVTGAP